MRNLSILVDIIHNILEGLGDNGYPDNNGDTDCG